MEDVALPSPRLFLALTVILYAVLGERLLTLNAICVAFISVTTAVTILETWYPVRRLSASSGGAQVINKLSMAGVAVKFTTKPGIRVHSMICIGCA
jgi:hypothetical protein